MPHSSNPKKKTSYNSRKVKGISTIDVILYDGLNIGDLSV